MNEVDTYHGQPILKEPTWTWEIPTYFFTGGLGGASAAVACLSEVRGDTAAARRAWAVAVAGLSVSPVLLILDLGRPARFVHMLRMVKVTSPMSIGSWILTVSATTTTIAAAHSWLGLFPRLSRAAGPVAGALGLPLSSYTAALIANTAVPVWHEARCTLPFVFVAGAGLSAGGALLLVTPAPEATIPRRIAMSGALAELALVELMKRRLGRHRRAYEATSAQRWERAARGAFITGAGLLAPRGGHRRANIAAGGLLLGGALATRWSIYRAGFASASDPAAVLRRTGRETS